MDEFNCSVCLDTLSTMEILCICNKCCNVLHKKCCEKLYKCPLCNNKDYIAGVKWYLVLPTETFVPHVYRNFKPVINGKITLKEAVKISSIYTDFMDKYNTLSELNADTAKLIKELEIKSDEKYKAEYNEYFDAFNTEWKSEVKALLSEFKKEPPQSKLLNERKQLLEDRDKLLHDWEASLKKREQQIQERELSLKEMEDKMFLSSYINKKVKDYHNLKQKEYNDYVSAQQQMMKSLRKRTTAHITHINTIESDVSNMFSQMGNLLEEEFDTLTNKFEDNRRKVEKELSAQLVKINKDKLNLDTKLKQCNKHMDRLKELKETNQTIVENNMQKMIDSILEDEKALLKQETIKIKLEKDSIIDNAKHEADIILNQAITKKNDIMKQLEEEKAVLKKDIENTNMVLDMITQINKIVQK